MAGGTGGGTVGHIAARRRTYLSLGLGEWAAAGVFVAMAWLQVGPRLVTGEAKVLWAALLPLVVILVVAGAYWLIARARLGAGPLLLAVAQALRVARVGTALLLLGSLVAIVAWWPQRLGVGIAAGVIWLFALMEWVNYFAVRLAYPWRQWASRVGQRRTPQLIRDVRAALATRPVEEVER